MKRVTACKTKKALLDVYQRATKDYSAAVTDLKSRMGISSREEFRNLCRLAEDARNGATKALTDLDDHIAEHEC